MPNTSRTPNGILFSFTASWVRRAAFHFLLVTADKKIYTRASRLTLTCGGAMKEEININ